MATIKATHRGNCQVCGRQHHVVGVVLAKHGYTVDYGYFSGTCRGSDNRPVQTDRTITDDTVTGLGVYAAQRAADAEKLKAGDTHPTKIKTGEKFNTTTRRFEPVLIDFAAGTPVQQHDAVQAAIARAESEAGHARAHAVSLKKMADELHGKPLVAIDDFRKAQDEARAAKRTTAVVDMKAATVSGTFGSKAARKEELDKISRKFEKEYDKIREVYLALPRDAEGRRVATEQQTEVYYGCHYPHEFTAKRRAAVLKAFPQCADIVAELDTLVAARNAVKSAP